MVQISLKNRKTWKFDENKNLQIYDNQPVTVQSHGEQLHVPVLNKFIIHKINPKMSYQQDQ